MTPGNTYQSLAVPRLRCRVLRRAGDGYAVAYYVDGEMVAGEVVALREGDWEEVAA